ncbi:unnamed protein product [Linum tenue]|uniref:Cysteine-rich transmembrane CYSTM domain-containing protein n=1 Tax=Linum tenue TaxID=586396 RepID=A0AAV0LZT0_9ROSI|nr:unnamed protein product [Linum tenue]
MTQYDNQSTGAPSFYPQLPQSSGSYVVEAPPPIGYPTRDSTAQFNGAVPVETKSRGDGFWKGWLCCVVLLLCVGRVFLIEEA